MASQSSSPSKTSTESSSETRSWSPPPPPSPKKVQPEPQVGKPVRKKTRSTRLRTGIDKHIPGITIDPPPSPPPPSKKKGISIQEPSPAATKKRKASEVVGKGKEKVGEKPKKARTKQATSAQGPSPPQPSKQQKKGKSSQFAVNAIEDIRHVISPLEGFSADISTFSSKLENDRYKETYLSKVFCPSVTIDIRAFQKECNFDLSPWIKLYESFVSLACPYTPSLVRMFYFKMEDDSVLADNGDLIEERLATTVRGVRFSFTADTLNQILKIEQPPPMPEFIYTNQEVYETLIPGRPCPSDQFAKLTFKPRDLPKEHRLLWYIFSRNFIPKGGNYTHFTSLDYRPFTAFVQGVPFNLGEWLFQGMKSFRFAKKPLTHIPYPSLVSVILFYHKIWYVGSTDTLEYPLPFGKVQLNLMKIKFDEEGVAQSQASMGNQEAQSAPPPPQAPLPDNLFDQIQRMVDLAIGRMSMRMEFELGKLRAELTRGHDGLIEIQDALKEHLQDLGEHSSGIKLKVEEIESKMTTYMINQIDLTGKVDQIIQKLHTGVPSSVPGSSAPASDHMADPSDSPVPSPAHSPVTSPVHSPPSHTFSFPSPPHTSPVHTISSPPSTSPPHSPPIPEPQASPITPTTELLPSPPSSPPTATTEHFPTPSPYAAQLDPIDPLTAMVVWNPPLVFLDPEYVDDDDKGGEDKQ